MITDLRPTVTVNGRALPIHFYTEERREQLNEVNEEINKYIEEHKLKTLDQIKPDVLATWRMRKATILWDFGGNPLPFEYYKSKSFEVGALKASEAFFLSERNYL